MLSNEVTTLSPDSIEQFRNWLSVRGRSEHTTKSYVSDLGMFLLEAGHSSVPLSQLAEEGMKWLQSRRSELSPKTTGRRLTSLKSFAKWAGMPGIFDDYMPPVPGKPIPKPLKDGMADVRKMLAHPEATEEMRVLIGLCGFAGLRIFEALELPPRNVDVQNMTITVRGKHDKTRTVPMSRELWAIIAETVLRRMDQPTMVDMADRTARARITQIGKAAGLGDDVASHRLRATFATVLMVQKKDLRLVQELLGHSSSKTTEAYTLVTMDRQREAVNDL
jgi:site-specific recombinase XerD